MPKLKVPYQQTTRFPMNGDLDFPPVASISALVTEFENLTDAIIFKAYATHTHAHIVWRKPIFRGFARRKTRLIFVKAEKFSTWDF